MNRARDSGLPAASGRVRLVQEGTGNEDVQAGFLIYVPVYAGGSVPASSDQRRRALRGFVYSPFRADDLLHGIVPAEDRSQLDLDVFDGHVSAGALLHRSEPRVEDVRFNVVRSLDVAGRPWTLVFRGGDTRGMTVHRTIVGLIVLAGSALSALLFVVTRGQVKGRIAAERTAEELRRSEERLRAADRAKDEFLATISHELRTPLNAIVGWTSMLTRRTIPPEMQQHAIAVIARNAAAQTRLVEDLLDLSRAVAGHLQLRLAPVDLHPVLQGAIDALRPAADDAGLTLDYRPGPELGQIEADAGRLQQILNNLLTNAIKFTPRGGRVTLRAARLPDSVAITVEDTGMGMHAEFVPHVFDRFRQADSSTTRAHPGAGLGLAIARHLVDLHGGSIEAGSEGLGRGSYFTVTLPAKARRL
jgi:signal transduction histidine kinase